MKLAAGPPWPFCVGQAGVVALLSIALGTASCSRGRTAAGEGTSLKPMALQGVLELAAKTVEEGPDRPRYTTLFFFTPQDCAAAIDEIAELDTLSQERKDLGLVAVLAYSNEDEAEQLREAFALKAPILLAEPALWREVVTSATPHKVVLDLSTSSLLMTSGPAILPSSRAAFRERLARLPP